jgi:hypothetical protein
MKILYNNRTNLVVSVFDESENVVFDEDKKVYFIGTNNVIYVGDKSNVSFAVGLTPPEDFVIGKYLINGGMWVINPDWQPPTIPELDEQ